MLIVYTWTPNIAAISKGIQVRHCRSCVAKGNFTKTSADHRLPSAWPSDCYIAHAARRRVDFEQIEALRVQGNGTHHCRAVHPSAWQVDTRRSQSGPALGAKRDRHSLHDGKSNNILDTSATTLDLGIILREGERDAVDAMPLVCWRLEPFALENMSKVTAAAVTRDFDAFHAPASVAVAIDGARNGVEEGRPAAAGVKLRSCFVQRGIASSTCVDAILGVMLVEFAGSGSLGALLSQNSKLFWVQLSAPFRFGHALRERLRCRLR